ncbi:MAG: hypothetical protein Q8M35_11435, partial [Pseudohongiella sp.]|nr:hypothetical protein [Pseudohongiella sp.]
SRFLNTWMQVADQLAVQHGRIKDINPAPERGPHMRSIYDLVEYDILLPLQFSAGRMPETIDISVAP